MKNSIILMLLIVSLAMGGYIIYDKVISTKEVDNGTHLQENDEPINLDDKTDKSDREKFLLSFYNDVDVIKKNNSLSDLDKATSIYRVYQKAIYSLFNDVENKSIVYTTDNYTYDIDKVYCTEVDSAYQSNDNYYICDEGAYSMTKDFSKIESNYEGLPLYLTSSSKNDFDIYDLAYQKLYQYIIKQKVKEYNADAQYIKSNTNETNPCVDYDYSSGNNYIDINMYSSTEGWYNFNILSGKCANTIKKYYTYRVDLDSYSYVRMAY